MVCEHLIPLENELREKGIKETFRGKAWTNNCREWVYYDCFLNRKSIRKRLNFNNCIKDHEHVGTHDGQEAGFVCELHNDAIMGVHEKYRKNKSTFR
jgi:hypothetical protein